MQLYLTLFLTALASTASAVALPEDKKKDDESVSY
jgi:hypothetical protein